MYLYWSNWSNSHPNSRYSFYGCQRSASGPAFGSSHAVSLEHACLVMILKNPSRDSIKKGRCASMCASMRATSSGMTAVSLAAALSLRSHDLISAGHAQLLQRCPRRRSKCDQDVQSDIFFCSAKPEWVKVAEIRFFQSRVPTIDTSWQCGDSVRNKFFTALDFSLNHKRCNANHWRWTYGEMWIQTADDQRLIWESKFHATAHSAPARTYSVLAGPSCATPFS